MHGNYSMSYRRCRALALGVMMTASVALSACATGGIAVNARVPDPVARYITGSANAVPAGWPQGVINVDLRTSGSEIVLHGRHGTLVIPYAAIRTLAYGPRWLPRGRNEPPAQERRYPWSTEFPHRSSNHYLKIEFRSDGHDDDNEVVLALGKALVKPTLAALERGSGEAIIFEALESCTQYKSPDECGVGHPEDLRGITTVFVDTSGSREWVDGESHGRITAAITAAGLALRMVNNAQDAGIVLAFRYDAGTKPQWIRGRNDIPDVAVGEVYVVHPDGLRVVMTFDEELSAWRTRLATRFAKAFLAAYREANR